MTDAYYRAASLAQARAFVAADNARRGPWPKFATQQCGLISRAESAAHRHAPEDGLLVLVQEGVVVPPVGAVKVEVAAVEVAAEMER